MDEQGAVSQAAATIGCALQPQQSALLARYATLVLRWNRTTNLTGARSRDEFIARHIADCLTVIPFIKGSRVLDLGSGAGLPGIVLACAVPALEFTLIESRGKRARFLDQARIELGLKNVRVVAARIQEWKPDGSIDTFVTRAFGTLSEFVAATHALQTTGCRLLAMKGRDPDLEIATLATGTYRVEVRRVSVPGWAQRHLVICDRLAR